MSCTELDRALHKQVLKREAWKEERFAQEKAARDAEIQLGFGATDMCKEELKKIIDSDRRMYYRTEELNDKLYIHYKGWKDIRGLEGWTGLRALYAECNAFDRIQGLHMCRNLRSLFLSENCIRRIEGLDNCPELWSLNLSNNFIERVEGLSRLSKLNTLTLAKNKIGFNGVEDLIELVGTSVSSLDVQDNKIWDPDVLPEVFSRMKDLRVLYLKGNPCGKKIPNYRKGITVYCEDLKYLDDRPVFPEDRRAAEAFNRGGLEEERAEKRRIRDEGNAKHEANMKAFQAMIDAARSEKRERDAMRLEDKFSDETDPVESTERRMKRQVDKWKEEHATELKDDAREHAERCLTSEKEHGTGTLEDVHARGPSQDNEEGADRRGNKLVDNRKLVYEDVWDPSEEEPIPAISSSALSFAPPSRRAADSSGASQASQAGGDVAPQCDNGHSTTSAQTCVAAGADIPAWYNKFAEIAENNRARGDLSASKQAIAPRHQQGVSHDLGRKPAPVDLSFAAELDEMD